MGFKAGWASPWICAILGIRSGVAIGVITEYYTSDKYKPTKQNYNELVHLATSSALKRMLFP